MTRTQLCRLAAAVVFFVGTSVICRSGLAETPTPVQALSLTPVQPNVTYTRPGKEEVAQCTIRAEKQGGATAWVVRNGRGETLRRFADTNGDNVVDQWCYFHDGLETYRDIDANFNELADQYRWFNASGTRWGIDKNEDRRIDAWKVISAPEVAEELVFALKTKDRARFELLLLTPAELAEAGFGRQQAGQIAETIKAAPATFSKVAAEQKVVTSGSEFVDFYRTRPATIPAGTDGSTKDVTIHDNASALVETGANHDQLFLGTLVSVGNTWKLLDVPTLGSDGPTPGGLLAPYSGPGGAAGGAAAGPPAQIQTLMEDLEKLDRQAAQTDPAEQGPITDKRAKVLEQLAEVSPDEEMRSEWIRQLADTLSSAVQQGGYPEGVDRLSQLAERLAKKDADDPLIAYVNFRHLWAEYFLHQQEPDADVAKLNEKWLEDLEAFATENPTSPDSAEALLQLGMTHEIASRIEVAKKWYGQLVKDFPDSTQATKAGGALRRLGSIGRPIRFQAKDLRGAVVDLAAAPYRGKVVVIHYWATWYDRCKEDMNGLRDVYAKYGGRGGFEIISVCLDRSPQAMQTFLAQNRYPWRQIHEPGGFEGRLANDMGVITLPLMVLVDQKGVVIDDNIFVAELNSELGKRLGTATAQGAGSLPSR